jgi:hypothetical protein
VSGTLRVTKNSRKIKLQMSSLRMKIKGK